LLQNTWEKNPLGRERKKWENNIKMDIEELGCDGRRWMENVQEYVE
jgi:hypothetical protein